MDTIAQTIAHRHLHEGYGTQDGEKRSGLMNSVENVVIFFAAPALGLAYAIAYAFVGAAALFCYGLKAMGVSCGLMKA